MCRRSASCSLSRAPPYPGFRAPSPRVFRFCSWPTLCWHSCSWIISGARAQPPEEQPMDLHLRGKRVLITGASKGIGAAIAEAFAEEGCHLELAARNKDAMDALAGNLRRAHNIDANVHAVDLRK